MAAGMFDELCSIVRRRILGVTVPLVSKEDAILSKPIWVREEATGAVATALACFSIPCPSISDSSQNGRSPLGLSARRKPERNMIGSPFWIEDAYRSAWEGKP
jgi:hypothetical protein